MTGARRVTRMRLADFSRRLKTLIDKAQQLRDEINRSIIAATPPAAQSNGAARRRRTSDAHLRKRGH